MSAADEFCGCGEYDCRECFTDPPRPEGNAWLDVAATEGSEDTDDTMEGQEP